MYKELLKKTYSLLDEQFSTTQSVFVNYAIQILIVLNALAIIYSSLPRLPQGVKYYLYIFEVFSVIVFTIEYVLRTWTCIEINKYKGSLSGRIKFALTPLQIIDLLAILPFYLALSSQFTILRVLRIFKIVRYSKALKLFGKVFYKKREELMSTFVLFLLYLVLASTVMFWIEHSAQPRTFNSIPAAMWWGVTTLTTIGYGDMVPITALGKIIGAVSSILGVSMYVLFSSIIVSGFLQEWNKVKTK